MKQAELFSEETADERQRPAPSSAGPEPSDAQARVLAATCFDRPLLVEAGAGTGKTATLVARTLTWSLGAGWDEVERERPGLVPEAIAPLVLRRIVAITFTEAAAAEMSARIGEALAKLQAKAGAGALDALTDRDLPQGLRCADLPAERAAWAIRARALRSALDGLNASTIHAFCRRLLANHPFEVRWAPDFAVDPSFARIELVLRDALEAYLRERWADRTDEDLIVLASAGHGPPELEATLLDLVRKGARAEDFRADPLAEASCARLCSELQRSAEALLAVARAHPDLARGQVAGETLEAMEKTRALESHALPTPRARLGRWAGELQKIWAKRRERVKDWRKQDFNGQERSALGEDVSAFSELAAAFETALEPWLGLEPDLLDRGRRIVLAVLERFEVELRAAGLASFDDLLRGAHALLRGHPDVAARERAAIRQLFVDEFQDTDELQCGIVELLALQGPRNARPGLFVVGDPKQSIYAWRNADLAAYDRFKERLCAPDVGGLVLRLTRNFRSVPAILGEVDAAVRPVMQAEFGVQPEFVALEGDREAAAGGPPPVEYWISWPKDEVTGALLDEDVDTLAAYETEAKAIALDLAAQASAGVPWKHSALLLRALTGVEVYLHALREHGIPYAVQSDKRYYERREVIDATALVCCVLDPNDQVALVTLLRSPLVGVPDAALLPLWKEQLPERLTWLTHVDEERLLDLEARVRSAAALVPASIPGLAGAEGWEESLIAALHSLAAARAAFQHEPVDSWVERLRALFPSEAVEAARFLGSFRLSNLERFFRELRRALQDRSGDAHSVLRTLRTNLARESESELTLPTVSDRDAVRVLTIHGSKGLQFQNVYLLQTSKPPRVEGSDPTEFENKGGRVSYAFFGTRSPAHADTRRTRDRAERAERVRLLYVAMTRACDRLIVLGGWKRDASPKPWSACERISELLANRAELGTALAELVDQVPSANAPRAWRDASGVRFALAADAPPAPALVPAHSQTEALPSVEAIAAGSARLARERSLALVHRARPLGAPASDEDHNGWIHARGESREGEGRSLGRSAAQAIGAAVHRALETLDLGAPLERELARSHADLAEFLEPLVEPHESAAALARARGLLDAAASHGLLARLFALGEGVIARELPVLLPPDDEPGGPLAFVSGAIDLLYRDPKTRELVVADYKTDLVETEAEIRARAALYGPQGRRYVRAVKEALGLEREPRFELWFLHSGTVLAP